MAVCLPQCTSFGNGNICFPRENFGERVSAKRVLWVQMWVTSLEHVASPPAHWVPLWSVWSSAPHGGEANARPCGYGVPCPHFTTIYITWKEQAIEDCRSWLTIFHFPPTCMLCNFTDPYDPALCHVLGDVAQRKNTRLPLLLLPGFFFTHTFLYPSAARCQKAWGGAVGFRKVVIPLYSREVKQS